MYLTVLATPLLMQPDILFAVQPHEAISCLLCFMVGGVLPYREVNDVRSRDETHEKSG